MFDVDQQLIVGLVEIVCLQWCMGDVVIFEVVDQVCLYEFWNVVGLEEIGIFGMIVGW